MARQLTGFIEGTIDGICFYKMEGKYYARTKSCLSGKRFWQDKSFEGSRKSCSRFGAANRIAAEIYREIPCGNSSKEIYRQLRNRAIALLKTEKTEPEIMQLLRSEFVVVIPCILSKKKTRQVSIQMQAMKNGSPRFQLR